MNQAGSHQLELTRANRLRLSRAFRFNDRVDFSIDCVIEGQMGSAFVDDPHRPTAYRIMVGPFWYFAGDAKGSGAKRMMSEFPAYNLLMPSPAPWSDLAHEVLGDRLRPNTRYRFSGANLSAEHLATVQPASQLPYSVVPIDADLARQLADEPDGYFDLTDYDSADDFVERGLGFCALEGNQPMGVAYSSLVCSRGIEVSIYVAEAFRRRGVATSLAAALLTASLNLGLHPNWDAANPESVLLAKKLGYELVGSYDAYYYID